MTNRLQAGLDFSHKRADTCLLSSHGQLLQDHVACANSQPGFQQFKALLLVTMDSHDFDGIDISGEATNYYWLPSDSRYGAFLSKSTFHNQDGKAKDETPG